MLRQLEVKAARNTSKCIHWHCVACRCEPVLREIKIIGRSSDTLVRELLEEFHIKKRGTSFTSVSLFQNEMQLLDMSV